MSNEPLATPEGYGSLENKNGFGAVIWRLLICERCGSLVADTNAAVILHNRLHDRIDRIAEDAFQGGGLIG